MKLSSTGFVRKWADRFADNDNFIISARDLREFSVDVNDTFGVSVANVPYYVAGTTYTVGYLVRYLPVGGKEGFYYAMNPGKLTAPGPGNLIDWKVVPGPVEPTALSQEMTLSQAQGLDGAGVVPGRTYLINCGPDGQGADQIVNVRGVSNDKFDIDGTLEVDTKRVAITDFNVQAGTWRVRQDSDFQHGNYVVQAADITTPASPLAVSVPGALAFGFVGVGRTGVTGFDPLKPLVDYASGAGQFTVSAGVKPALKAGDEIFYAYLTGSVQAPGVTPAQLAAVATTLPLQAGQGASYTLRPDDIGTIVPFIGSQAMTLTIPTGLGLPAPAPGASAGAARVCYPLQYASGQLTLAAAPGVTLITPPGQGLKSSGQGCRFVLIWLDSNIILVEGGI